MPTVMVTFVQATYVLATFFHISIHDIENIVEDYYAPHLLGISESNLKKGDNLTDVQLEDYSLHT